MLRAAVPLMAERNCMPSYFACGALAVSFLSRFSIASTMLPQTAEPTQAAKALTVSSTAQLIGVLPDLTELQRLSDTGVHGDRWQIL
jgi:hypothetical protein